MRANIILCYYVEPSFIEDQKKELECDSVYM